MCGCFWDLARLFLYLRNLFFFFFSLLCIYIVWDKVSQLRCKYSDDELYMCEYGFLLDYDIVLLRMYTSCRTLNSSTLKTRVKSTAIKTVISTQNGRLSCCWVKPFIGVETRWFELYWCSRFKQRRGYKVIYLLRYGTKKRSNCCKDILAQVV